MPVTIYKKKGKADKADTLTLRLPAKVKFAIELLAQQKSCTLSAVVIEALKEPLHAVDKGLTVINASREGGEERVYIPDLVWHPLEPDRIVKLGLHAPQFLSDRMQVVWNCIKENPEFWPSDDEPNFKAIRDNWQNINREADANLDEFGK